MLSLPVIGVGLVVEIVALKLLFGLQWRRAAWYALAVNAISAALGLFLLPIAGIAWELGPGQVANEVTGAGTFNPVTWVATVLLAILISTGIEGFCLIKLFRLRLDWRRWFGWTVANAVSVGLAAYSLTRSFPSP